MTDLAATDLAALVQDTQIHRDVYLSEDIFRLERERLFARSWLYVGHDSQIPEAGDYITLEVIGHPLIMVRHTDGQVRVLINRCAHKGARLLSEPKGRLENPGRLLRCPYHAWQFDLDGRLRAVSVKAGYRETGFDASPAAQGLAQPGAIANYRGFVFIRLSKEGAGFEDYFGPVLRALDNMADRSPTGQLQLAGGCLRSEIRCNWKMYLENINDTIHPISTHESAASTAGQIGPTFAQTDPTALEQLLPFGAGYDFYTKMGAQTLPNGHSVLGTRFSLHTDWSDVPGYQEQLQAAHGTQRTQEILSFAPQNVVLYPSLSVKASPQIIRVLRPVSAGVTRLEAWAFQPKDAPQTLLVRGLTYNRLVFSPMSVVAHDDIHLFESQQTSLACAGNPWVNLQRQYRPSEQAQDAHDMQDGNNELLMRNQYRAWLALMQPSMKKEQA